MSRLVAEHFNEDGRPKLKFTSRGAANDYIRRNELNCYPYRCSFCSEWHIATIREDRSAS